VVYDYGQGGVWAFIWAQSADDIRQRFRDLEVVNTLPSWLGGSASSTGQFGQCSFDRPVKRWVRVNHGPKLRS
jgi:hypothetical protein